MKKRDEILNKSKNSKNCQKMSNKRDKVISIFRVICAVSTQCMDCFILVPEFLAKIAIVSFLIINDNS